MRYIIILLLLTSCSTLKQKSSSDSTEKVIYKTQFIDTSKSVHTKTIEYVPFYDTLTQTYYIYPKTIIESKSDFKGITDTKDSSKVVSVQKESKSVKKTKTYYFEIIAISIILLVVMWFWHRIKLFIKPF